MSMVSDKKGPLFKKIDYKNIHFLEFLRQAIKKNNFSTIFRQQKVHF